MHKLDGCRFEVAQVQSWIFFFFHLLFKHTLCSYFKSFKPQDLLVYRLCLHQILQSYLLPNWVGVCKVKPTLHTSWYTNHKHHMNSKLPNILMHYIIIMFMNVAHTVHQQVYSQSSDQQS